jgi:hypothetical protein
MIQPFGNLTGPDNFVARSCEAVKNDGGRRDDNPLLHNLGIL